MRIPFDSLTLASVTAELQEWLGARVQGVRQPDESTLTIELYRAGSTGLLLINWHPELARVHFTVRKRPNPITPPGLCAAVRAAIDGGRFVAASQIGCDRVLDLGFTTAETAWRIVAEPMGRHANVFLLDEENRIRGWGRRPGRELRLAGKYVLPEGVDPTATTFGGPFYKKLLAEGAVPVDLKFAPVISPGNGAYPISVASLGLREFARPTISLALDSHYAEAAERMVLERERGSILVRLNRILLAREAALQDLSETVANAGRAGQWQRWGELILAYGYSLSPGARALEAFDYDGAEVRIILDPEKTPQENAQAYFARAKRTKGSQAAVTQQKERFTEDRGRLVAAIERLKEAKTIGEIEGVLEEAKRRRWIIVGLTHVKPGDRPFDGHRVRELVGPGGVVFLFGENAEANDYLTMRVARANDYWLHVRGGTSAHVVIRTNNQPQRIGPEHLVFAAQLAVRNSPSKHSKFVAVDYVLKKHVRKPKGAPVGTVSYANEKTLHVDGAE